MVDLWAEIHNYIKERVGDTAFAAWFTHLKSIKKDSRTLTLVAPDEFFKDWIKKHYLGLIQEALRKICGQNISVQLQVDSKLFSPKGRDHLAYPESKSKESPQISYLNPRYTFENFVVGPSNRFAHAASLAVAESPARAYNPLFIYGGVGLGKTHLMQAICHKIKTYPQGNNLKICYVSSETFTNELINAIQHHSTNAFRQKYRSVDVLVIDDIHFIAGKESTQEEFFHTFNTLYDAYKQIIISSDRPPKEIPRLEERLISRFGWGLVTDIQPPNLETRIAILKKKMEGESVKPPDEVIFFIAQLIKTNIRELEGALIKVIAYALLEEKPITLQLAKDALKELLKESQKFITPEQILHIVTRQFNISLQDLKNKRRNKNIVLQRQIAMYLCRELTDLSLPEIGNCFGGKDHTTVLHAYNKIKHDLINNTQLQNIISRLTQDIHNF
jgi:chromosomal replication initiator protein